MLSLILDVHLLGVLIIMLIFVLVKDKLHVFLARQTIPGLGIVVDPCAALLSSLVQAIVASVNLSRLAGLDMIFLMVIVGLVPYYTLDPDTPISSTFGDSVMQWAAYILTTGAITATR
ncbi:unnamed protein product [Eruca vesicaria subsp. sativa]|uniref:Uncharacterized protein n=1 Tax=Eruca vesicaria subsp. sativa TaxID=29727 RepID=A0ABC8J1E1_ERUVS|nr:unnamed protein product [Eruca vesicaria subsp. sativa]